MSEFIITNATTEDLKELEKLLSSVHLPLAGVKEHLKHFSVLKDDDCLVGSVGFEVYNSKALLRSLAVAKGFQGTGLGDKLFRAGIEYARNHAISEIYILTDTAESFFAKRGFKKVSRNEVDEEVKKSVEFVSACPESAVCMKLVL